MQQLPMQQLPSQQPAQQLPAQQFMAQQLAALPPVPEIPNPQPSFSSPLTTLAPLSESLPAVPLTLPEPSTQLIMPSPTPNPVGSDLLLRNSGRTVNPNISARVFRSQ